MLFPCVIVGAPDGDAQHSSPDPIANDPRKALDFQEGDACVPFIRKAFRCGIDLIIHFYL